MSEETTGGPIGESGGGSAAVASEPTETTGSPITRDALVGMLPEDIRGEAVFQNLNAENPIPDLANQFLNAQKMTGRHPIEAPQENWGDEQWNAFWGKVGRPETVDGYTVPEVEGVQWDDEKVGAFKEFAFENGLTGKQFEPLLQKYAELTQADRAQADAALAETVEKQLGQLKADLTREGKDYDAVIELANEGLMSFKDESLNQLFHENRVLANHPAIVKMFAQLAEANRESIAKTAGVGRVNTTLDARAAIESFKDKHNDLLMAEPEKLDFHQRDKRDKLLSQLTELYQKAYPDEVPEESS